MAKVPRFSREAFDRAAGYIKAHARPLEKAKFSFLFEGGTPEQVIDELTEFRHADGGFGAIESDFGSNEPNVLSTTHALQTFMELRLDKSHQLAQEAVNFLAESYVEKYKSWPLITPHDNSKPHAPWWHYTEKFDEIWSFYRDNPRPEVLGYLYNFGSEISADIQQEVMDAVVDRLPAIETLQVHDLACYTSLFEVESLPRSLEEALQKHLPGIVNRSIETDPTKWHTYCTTPLEIIPSPNSRLFSERKDAVTENLSFEIEAQAENGCWEPAHNWGDSFPEAWEAAKKKWQGVNTVRRLWIFKNFDCLPD